MPYIPYLPYIPNIPYFPNMPYQTDHTHHTYPTYHTTPPPHHRGEGDSATPPPHHRGGRGKISYGASIWDPSHGVGGRGGVAGPGAYIYREREIPKALDDHPSIWDHAPYEIVWKQVTRKLTVDQLGLVYHMYPFAILHPEWLFNWGLPYLLINQQVRKGHLCWELSGNILPPCIWNVNTIHIHTWYTVSNHQLNRLLRFTE